MSSGGGLQRLRILTAPSCRTKDAFNSTVPGSAWHFTSAVTGADGYTSLRSWDAAGFFGAYTMVLLIPCFFFGWKFMKTTKMVEPDKADLLWDAPIIETYEASFTKPPVTFWFEMAQLIRLKKGKMITTSGQCRTLQSRASNSCVAS